MTIVQNTKTTLLVVLTQFFGCLFILVIVYWRYAQYERLHHFSTSLMIMKSPRCGGGGGGWRVSVEIRTRNIAKPFFSFKISLNTENNLKNR
jgi:hypothetical protein